MERLRLKQRYTRSDPNGAIPRVSGRPSLEYNRLAAFWRPLIDMTDGDLAPMRLRTIRPVASWLADATSERWPWFSRIGVAGVRHQVVRHAGLDEYDCRVPGDLPERLRTPEWNGLVEAIDEFADLGIRARTLVICQLTQLSYYGVALRLAGPVSPNGDPLHDRYVYEVGRVHARSPGGAPRALALFESLAMSSKDRQVALGACFQGIGHAIRSGGDLGLARRLEYAGRGLAGLPDGWHTSLVRSRFHRALAVLRLTEGDREGTQLELGFALEFHEELLSGLSDDADRMVADENRRFLLEVLIDAATREPDTGRASEVRLLCDELIGIDPNCVQARLLVGDSLLAIGDYQDAARWYSRAGELGTGSGAVGWFRAAQCYDFMGERGDAVNAMGHCLQLDATAVEARDYVAGARRR